MRNLIEAIQFLNKRKNLNEMAFQIGTTKDSYVIYVNYKDGGNIPHFHYVDLTSMGKDKKKGFHTCIKIEKAEYFLHEGKMNIITSGKQRKELDRFLSEKFDDPNVNMTNWEFIRMTWNKNNSGTNVDVNTQKPDYTNIKEESKKNKA